MEKSYSLPQMAPMHWLFLFIVFSTMALLTSQMLFFSNE